MRLNRIFTLLIIIYAILFLSSCGTKEKQRAIECYKDIIEWMQSDEYEYHSLNPKRKEFANKHGFKSYSELCVILSKNDDDPEIKRLNAKLNKIFENERDHGGRNTSTPEDALLGHWKKTKGTVTHYYFKDGIITNVIDNEEVALNYIVLESSKSNNWIKIRIYGGQIWNLKLSFDDDYESLTMSEKDQYGDEYFFKWYYVDNKQEP